MIIDAEYIYNLRQVARNIEPQRIEMYILESEKLDILPAIGAKLYQKFTNMGKIVLENENKTLGTESGAVVSVGDEGDLSVEERKLLNGGYYTDKRGEYRHFEGLKAALGYLAYARFMFNHSAQVTPFGVVVKSGDESTPADARTVAAMANDARKIGREHLASAILYWADVQDKCPDVKGKVRRRFVKIGN